MCDKLISIIIPYYNAKRYFEETLNSVYKQTGVDFELIVVNDGSTKEDEKYLEQTKKQYGFTLIYQINKGVSAARNAGLAIAQGTHVLFLDADDCLLTDALLQLEKNSNDAVIVGNYVVESKITSVDLSPKQFIQGNPIQVGTALIPIKLAKNIGGFNERFAYSEDMDFWFRLWMYGAQFKLLNQVVLNYRVHENSAMRQQSKKLYYDNACSFNYRIKHSKQLYSKEVWYKQVVINRLSTLHWYARMHGIKTITKNYLFASKNGLMFTLFFKMGKSDWRYLLK